MIQLMLRKQLLMMLLQLKVAELLQERKYYQYVPSVVLLQDPLMC